MKATSTKTVYDGERMIGIVDDFTHICVEGRELHPFAIVPFADAQDDLWRTLREKLDLRPAE